MSAPGVDTGGAVAGAHQGVECHTVPKVNKVCLATAVDPEPLVLLPLIAADILAVRRGQNSPREQRVIEVHIAADR